MKLLYMWIKDYGSLKCIGLNFNCKYKFDYSNEKSELSFIEKDVAIDGFFNVITRKEKITQALLGKSEEQIPQDLNNRIESLAAIVGNNGAGKTTILDLISYIFTYQLDTLPEGIYCFLENDEIYIHSTLNKDITLKIEENTNKKFFKCNLIELDIKYNSIKNIEYKLFLNINGQKSLIENSHKMLTVSNHLLTDNINVIYFSNEFNSKYTYKKFRPIKDISTSGLIYGDFNNDYENRKVSEDYGLIRCFNDNEFLRQIEYIYDSNQNINNYLDFELPKRVFVTFRDNSYILLEVYQKLNSEFKEYNNIIDINKKIFDEIYKIKQKNDDLTEESRLLLNIYNIYHMFSMTNINEKLSEKEVNQILFIKFSVKILLGIFSCFLHEYLIIFSRSKDEDNEFYKNINESIERSLQNNRNLFEHDTLYKFFIDFLKEILQKENKYMSDEVHKRDEKYIECIERLKSDLVQSMVVDTMGYTSFNQQFTLEVNHEDIINNIKSFYDCYKITSNSAEYLNFSWGISSGEYNMITLFARMYSLVKNEEVKNSNDLIILIDEADLSYHPTWQQKYMKNLLSFLKENFKHHSIQLILTTHSPILLSDIPKENTIFLKKIKGVTEIYKNKEQTFGANIYDLYRNGFFLTNSNYGILGDFATGKIERVENILVKLLEKMKSINEAAEKEVKALSNNTDYVNKDKIIIEKTKIIRNKLIDVKEDCIRKLDQCKNIIDIIGEEFLRKTLLRQYNQLYEFFNMNCNNDNEELGEIKIKFEKLSKDEQNELIRFIIDKRKN
ncbi:AAA family ATPase [Clostridium butyricum]|uniref:AAA family ATPase n=1 Tax=Clostridium butyricum TaxID=1492 RepID=UPI001CA9E346|nr:AAA family ATPase [Clostridium butyricum]MBZ0313335.1 hypothetical protein [Clostridium butyricum]MDU5103086.1 hypothetical protein [Clostridium butyricum]